MRKDEIQGPNQNGGLNEHDILKRSVGRREVLRLGGAGVAGVVLGLAIQPLVGAAGNQNDDSVGKIYQLQAAFHRAKTNQDIDLMMSLWADNGILNNQGDPNSPYVGAAVLRNFWLGSGSFKNRRFSFVPSFKEIIKVSGDQAFLYFECHDVGDYDLSTRSIAADTFLAGSVRKLNGSWLFSNMTAGKSSPLSPSTYYFPIPQS